jgi:DNA-binding CsgD family transcriptional regulator/tetratricopeptide (TPR) repeat protein
VLALPGAHPPEVIGRVLAGAAMIAYRRGRYELATAHAERVLALSERAGDSVLAARAITVLGNVAFDHGELELAVTRYREALARFRTADDIDGMADTLSKSGLVLTSIGLLEGAAAALEESLALGRDWNRPVWITTSTGRLAFVDQLRGDLVSAEARVTEVLPMQRQLNPISAVAHLWLGASVARDAGDFPLSAARYRESLELRWKWGEPRGIAESLAGIVELAVLTGRPLTAVRLFGAVEALRQRIGVPGYRWEQERREQAIARARQQLGDEAFAAALDEGTRMHRPGVIGLAVEVAREIEAQVPETPAPAPAPDVHPYDPREREAIVRLTGRELEVLCWLADGLTDREIGEALFISPRTVARHLHSIYQKLDVSSRSAATAFAHRNGVA